MLPLNWVNTCAWEARSARLHGEINNRSSDPNIACTSCDRINCIFNVKTLELFAVRRAASQPTLAKTAARPLSLALSPTLSVDFPELHTEKLNTYVSIYSAAHPRRRTALVSVCVSVCVCVSVNFLLLQLARERDQGARAERERAFALMLRSTHAHTHSRPKLSQNAVLS